MRERERGYIVFVCVRGRVCVLREREREQLNQSLWRMAWVVDGRTFARKVKNPTHGMSRRSSTENQLECPSCHHEIDMSEIMPEWPGLPSGVKFDPSDQEILEHLAAKVGIDATKPHPFINEFIPTLEVEDGICYTHPEKLPGIRRDGNSTHFFHRPTRAYTTGTRKRRKVQSSEDEGEIRWHKTGKTRPVVENGKQLGCKKIMVLYVSFGKKTKPDKTNWVMHQYHLGVQEEEREGELVVSKVFYQTQPRQSVAIGRDNVDEIEQVVSELTEEPSNDSFGVSSMPKTPAPINSQQVSHPKGLLETLSEDVNRLQASLSFEKSTAASPEAAESRGVLEEENASSEQVQVRREDELVDAAEGGLPKEEHVPVLGLGSQPFSGSFDADLLKLLCNENLKAFSQGNGCSDWKSVAAEACAKLDSQDAISLDKIVLGTPPDLLEFLFNSQGTTADWTEKLKLWSDSQKMEDFNLADFLQNSQSSQ